MNDDTESSALTMADSHGHEPAGWFAIGPRGPVAQWDGEAWTGELRDLADDPPLPVWRRRATAFLRHSWWRWMLIGYLLVAGLSAAGAALRQPWLAWSSGVGMVIFMVGAVLIVARHVGPATISSGRTLVGWGIASGVVAIAIALPLEAAVGHVLKTPAVGGPIEETTKLLVPILLLALAPQRFAAPRAGVILVLVSGATFGAIEGILGSNPELTNSVASAMQRPSVELLHPWLTAFAAAIIWLAAWRGRKVITRAGLVAWLIAVALHSLYDGTLGSTGSGNQQTSSGSFAITRQLEVGAGIALVVLIIAVAFFYLCRHGVREVTPPSMLGTNAPHWRPLPRRWGLRKRPDRSSGARPSGPDA